MKLRLLFYSPNWDAGPDIEDIYGQARMDGVVEWDGENLSGPRGLIDMVLHMTRGKQRTDPAMVEEAMRFAPLRIANAYQWCKLEGAEPRVPDVLPWERWAELAEDEAGEVGKPSGVAEDGTKPLQVAEEPNEE